MEFCTEFCEFLVGFCEILEFWEKLACFCIELSLCVWSFWLDFANFWSSGKKFCGVLTWFCKFWSFWLDFECACEILKSCIEFWMNLWSLIRVLQIFGIFVLNFDLILWSFDWICIGFCKLLELLKKIYGIL